MQHDVRLPDKHHRGLRQRDVWIEARICNHFPVSVLVSCKRWKRKLHSGDVEAFYGELESSGARVGVLYSYSGFTKPAVEKAKALKVPCCRFCRGSVPEIPKELSLTAYCCTPRVFVRLQSNLSAGWEFRTWGELFRLPVTTPDGESTLLDELVRAYHEAEKSSARSKDRLPEPFGVQLTIPPQVPKGKSLKVAAYGCWKFYRAKLEAFEVNGSYEFTSKDFKGQIITPSVDRLGPEPGPGWELVEGTPRARPSIIMMLFNGNTKDDGVIRKLTGHRSRELERYQHLSQALKQQTVEVVAAELFGTNNGTPGENAGKRAEEEGNENE